MGEILKIGDQGKKNRRTGSVKLLEQLHPINAKNAARQASITIVLPVICAAHSKSTRTTLIPKYAFFIGISILLSARSYMLCSEQPLGTKSLLDYFTIECFVQIGIWRFYYPFLFELKIRCEYQLNS